MKLKQVYLNVTDCMSKCELSLESNYVWPERVTYEKGHNIVNKPLIDIRGVILPEMHIRHGIGSQFLKRLVKDNESAS